MDAWVELQEDHLAYYLEMFSLFDFSLVIEDEVEHFRDWNHDQFNYPYEKRMVIVNEVELDIEYSAFSDSLREDPTYYQYNYEIRELIFQHSEACLEPNPFNQL